MRGAHSKAPMIPSCLLAANKFLGANENERSTARSLCAAAYDLRRLTLRMLKVGRCRRVHNQIGCLVCLTLYRLVSPCHCCQNRNSNTEKAFKANVLPEWFAALDK